MLDLILFIGAFMLFGPAGVVGFIALWILLVLFANGGRR